MYAQFTSCVQWGKFRYCNFIPPDIDSLTSGKETEVVPWFISKSDGSERCLSSFSDLSWLELFPESCLFKGTLRLRWIENGLVPKLNNYHFEWSWILITFKKIKNFMAPYYGWGSTATRLEPLRGGSLLFSTKFPKFLVLILSPSEG